MLSKRVRVDEPESKVSDSQSSTLTAGSKMDKEYSYSRYFYGGRKRKLSKAAVALARAADSEQRKAKFYEAVDSLKEIITNTGGLEGVVENDEYRTAKITGSGAYKIGAFTKGARKLLGNKILSAAQDRVSRAITGSGEYGRQSFSGSGSYVDNQLIVGGDRAGQVIGHGDETDSITVSDSEYVRDIYAPTGFTGSSTFATEIVAVNVGSRFFAPNLCQLALNFTEYEMKQLVFELRPQLSESNVNNGQTGSIFMAFNYNSNDDPFDTKEQLMGGHAPVSGRIVDGLRCGVECDPTKTNKTSFFVRSGPVPYQKDADEYDFGNLTIATNNIPAALAGLQIAELHVHYTVTLRKRRVAVNKLDNQLFDLYRFDTDVSGNNWAGQFAQPAPGGALKNVNNSLGTSILTAPGGLNTALDITFPAFYSGYVEIQMLFEGTGLVTSGESLTKISGNVTFPNDIYAGQPAGDTPTNEVAAYSATSSVAIFHCLVKSATGNVANIVRLEVVKAAGTVTQMQLSIREISQGHWLNRNTPAGVFITR